ncbi:hypothetical protein [Streptomyces sp. NPDC058595]|uniref:hypothetical protein n=1 Tax=Streptomyces sp. NPDC058595 TaxID=3346550 RepID=UPI003658BF09
MTTKPTRGWDQAVFSCGRCGAQHTATTEADYLKAVGVHGDAHAVWDRLNPVERDGFIAILRILSSVQDLATELLALADRQTGPETAGEPRLSRAAPAPAQAGITVQ